MAVVGTVRGARVGGGGSDSDSVAILAGSTFGFSTAGGRSVVLCLPVVHGGIDMNSSKVKTLGLQHFHPIEVRLDQTNRWIDFNMMIWQN